MNSTTAFFLCYSIEIGRLLLFVGFVCKALLLYSILARRIDEGASMKNREAILSLQIQKVDPEEKCRLKISQDVKFAFLIFSKYYLSNNIFYILAARSVIWVSVTNIYVGSYGS